MYQCSSGLTLKGRVLHNAKEATASNKFKQNPTSQPCTASEPSKTHTTSFETRCVAIKTSTLILPPSSTYRGSQTTKNGCTAAKTTSAHSHHTNLILSKRKLTANKQPSSLNVMSHRRTPTQHFPLSIFNNLFNAIPLPYPSYIIPTSTLPLTNPPDRHG